MIDIKFSLPNLPEEGALGLFLGEGESLAGIALAADEACGGALRRAFAAAEFTGKEHAVCTVLAPGAGLSRVVAVGLGKAAELTDRRMEEAGGLLAANLARAPQAFVAAEALTPGRLAHAGFGAILRGYRFDTYRTKPKPEDKPKLAALTFLTEHPETASASFAPLHAAARGAYLTRDLASEPANVLTPAEMARRLGTLTEHGLQVETLGPDEMKKLGMGALLGVAQGSHNPPRLVVLRWDGGKPGEAPLAFIGKGVTFDTGGISIKPAAGMEDMKWDMAGAGTVAGLMLTLALRRARVNAVGLVGLVENMPGGAAQRPGDVVKSASGQTIEVLNTDAEGRLVLADVLWYAQDKHNPALMVDLATLTGAIIVGLGHEHAGLFSNDDTLSNRLLAAGLETGEKLWRLPMGPEYDKQLKSDIADMKNITGRPGSSITAAQFLARFVSGKPWAHLDIAGMAWATKDAPTVPKGATAFGVRLLDRFVAANYEG